MLTIINKYGKRAVFHIATVFGPVYHVAYGKVLWNTIFETFIYSPFTESVISEIHRLWVWSFFRKCWKFNVDFRNEEKNWEKLFCFSDNSLWIGCFTLSLLRREDLSSGVDLLPNSLKILHRTKIDFLQLNYFNIDQ